MYEYSEEVEWRRYSATVIRVFLNGHCSDFTMTVEMDILKTVFGSQGTEWMVHDEVTDETIWRRDRLCRVHRLERRARLRSELTQACTTAVKHFYQGR